MKQPRHSVPRLAPRPSPRSIPSVAWVALATAGLLLVPPLAGVLCPGPARAGGGPEPDPMFARAKAATQRTKAPNPARSGKQIYFGDLHTHSNLSMDAVLAQIFQGVNRGPEAACTFARACAQVDFYGQSDHAEMLDQEAWDKSVSAVKACNAKPDMSVFQGFEWTSSATGRYWGHKNVFFRNDKVPEMPVAAYTVPEMSVAGGGSLLNTLSMFGREQVPMRQGLWAANRSIELFGRPRCADAEEGQLCIRVADTPAELWSTLNSYYRDPAYAEAGYDATVIPHGTAWGMAKLGTDWDIQLNPEQHDPNLQRIIEVYSGHGNSEEYRDFSDPDVPFESCGERAAKLQWTHCRRGGGDRDDCRAAARTAFETVRVSFPTDPEDWGMCNQCTDCFQPAERYQPDGSAQAALAKTGFSDAGSAVSRYQFGFIAATDDHSSRPAGVMEFKPFTDWPIGLLIPGAADTGFAGGGRNSIEAERITSFMFAGGLVAIHAADDSRDALWDGLKRREVYGTSGPRMALWFDAETDSGRVPMGRRVTGSTSPTFQIEVWGGPEERPGCNAATRAKWGDEVIDDVCLGTCFNPSGRRTGIDRLEIIKITPQKRPDEQIAALIHDPYRVIENPERTADGRPTARMVTSFTDPAFAAGGRDAVYYVRAVQEPTPSVNGTPMRNAEGGWEACDPNLVDDCTTMAEERAWSSPIYADFETE